MYSTFLWYNSCIEFWYHWLSADCQIVPFLWLQNFPCFGCRNFFLKSNVLHNLGIFTAVELNQKLRLKFKELVGKCHTYALWRSYLAKKLRKQNQRSLLMISDSLSMISDESPFNDRLSRDQSLYLGSQHNLFRAPESPLTGMRAS